VREKLVIGNWKMHGSLAANAALLEGIKAVPARARLAVCAPFPYLAQCQSLLAGSGVGWGAQDVSAEARGAFTGEVAASMLAEFGVSYALVGHSERRSYHGESDATVAAKALRALEFGIVPVVCVGESLAQREAGETEAVVGHQLGAVLEALSLEQLGRIVLAYEPVWAIGTGKTATPEIASHAHHFLRQEIRKRYGAEAAAACRILYGGSVKPDNIKGLMAQPDLDGALVGGASLDPVSFASIVNF
jgi:triosephosphate isomerase